MSTDAAAAVPVVAPETSPAVEAPAVEAPAVEAPAVEAPAVEAPAVEAPVLPPAVGVAAVVSALATDVTGKYDVVLVNTPWHRMSVDELIQLPVQDIAAEDATLFMWCDSFTAGSAPRLMKKWGFTFHSVTNILNLMNEPAPVEDAAPAAAAPADETDAEMTDSGAPAADASKPAKTRTARVKALHPPSWWISSEGASSRACTEQLWMAVRGAGAPATTKGKVRPQPYQVKTLADFAKKSCRARRPAATCHPDWFCTRPIEFFEAALAQIAPTARVLEMFGDVTRAKRDAFGPGLPQMFVPALDGEDGDVGIVKKALAGHGKVALRGVCAKLHKAIAGSAEDVAIVQELVAQVAAAAAEAGRQDAAKWTVPGLPGVLQTISSVADRYLANYPQRKKRAKRARSDEPGRVVARHGIACPGPVTQALLEFFGEPEGTQLARTDVVKRINAYIKEHNLKAGKEFMFDDKLKALLAAHTDAKSSDYFQLHRLLTPHFIKKAAVVEEGGEQGDAKKARVQ
jgi:hypothetical protein